MNNMSLLCANIWFKNKINIHPALEISKIYIIGDAITAPDILYEKNIKDIVIDYNNHYILIPLSVNTINICNSKIGNPDLSGHINVKNITIYGGEQQITIPPHTEELFIWNASVNMVPANIKEISLYHNNQNITIPLSAEIVIINNSIIANPDLSEHKNLRIIDIEENNQEFIIPKSVEKIYIRGELSTVGNKVGNTIIYNCNPDTIIGETPDNIIVIMNYFFVLYPR